MVQHVKSRCWQCGQPIHLTFDKPCFDRLKNLARKLVSCQYCEAHCEVVVDGAMVRADRLADGDAAGMVWLDELEPGFLFYRVFPSYRPVELLRR